MACQKQLYFYLVNTHTHTYLTLICLFFFKPPPPSEHKYPKAETSVHIVCCSLAQSYKIWAGETTQWLRLPAALPEGPHGSSQLSVIPFPKPLLASEGTVSLSTQTRMQPKYLHT